MGVGLLFAILVDDGLDFLQFEVIDVGGIFCSVLVQKFNKLLSIVSSI